MTLRRLAARWRRIARRPERTVAAGDVAFLLEERWRTVTPAERPDLFEVEVCRGCGCTELRACVGGCWWVGRGLCSRCWPTHGGSD